MREVPPPLSIDSDEFEQFADALHRLVFLDLVVEDDRLGNLLPNVPYRVQRVHRALEDDRDFLPPNLPDPHVGSLDEVPTAEHDGAGNDPPVVREEAHQGEGGGRLPASALSREAKCFALIKGKGNSGDRVHRTGFGGIFDDEVLDLEEQSLSPPQPRIQDFVEGEPEQVESEHKEDETEARDDKPPDVASNHECAAADRLVEPEEVDGSDSSGNHDHEDEPRNGQDDVVEAHHHLVDPASDVTGDEPHGRPKDAGDHRREDPHDEADLGPPDDLGKDVGTLLADSQQVLGTRRAERTGDVRDAIARVRDPVNRAVRGEPLCEDRHADEEHEDRESNHGRPAVSDAGPHFLHSTEGDPAGGLEWRDNSGSDYHFGRSHVFPSRNLDPGVEQKEDEVGDEVRKHDRNAPDDDDELEERKVEVVDGLDCLPANSVIVEDDLHLVGSTDHEGDVERDQGDHWRQTARENVTAEDLAVAEPFRLRGRDEVLRHDVDEGAPHDERNSGERAERKGQGRQDEVLSGARQVGSVPRPRSQHVVVVPLGRQGGPPREVVTDDGAFLEHCEEEEPEPEDRHPIEEDSRGGRKDVERLASLLRCD